MILEQIYCGCLSQASYLIGDEGTRSAAVVDPERDVQVYLDLAARRGLTIRHVMLTHFHADFVAGHVELARRTGAKLWLGSQARADYPFAPLAERERLALGEVGIETLETPGHTPESVSLLVSDPAQPHAPHAVLTGDTLFIGDVGRPDLMASAGCSAGDLAGQLYDSLHGKLMKLPDATLVYPGHGAGSACGKNLSQETVSTIGKQRRFNVMLQSMPKQGFVELATSGLPPAPRYFARAAALNRRELPPLDLGRARRELPLAGVLAAAQAGAQLLDVRDAATFARGHLPGSVHVGLDGRFATWAGTVLDPERSIVLIGSAAEVAEAALQLGRIGFDDVLGSLTAEVGRARRIERLTAGQLDAELRGPNPPLVLDVRQHGERQQSRIAGSQHLPLDELAARHAEIPRGRRVVVHCAGGYRSMIAASLLAPLGFQDLADLEGGMAAWQRAGR